MTALGEREPIKRGGRQRPLLIDYAGQRNRRYGLRWPFSDGRLTVMIAPMTDALPNDVHDAVRCHCARGEDLSEGKKFREAIVEYNKAWALLPDPKGNWNASTWILAAIGDAAFSGGFTDLAKQAFDDVMLCPEALGNPFIHLRRGQILFDGGNLDAAADELMRAYMGGGPELFEAEAPKYLEFLSTRAAI